MVIIILKQNKTKPTNPVPKIFIFIFTNFRTESRGIAWFPNGKLSHLRKQLYLRQLLAPRIHAISLFSLLEINEMRNEIIVKVIKYSV